MYRNPVNHGILDSERPKERQRCRATIKRVLTDATNGLQTQSAPTTETVPALAVLADFTLLTWALWTPYSILAYFSNFVFSDGKPNEWKFTKTGLVIQFVKMTV